MKDFSSIVVSSMVELRRNLLGFVFPQMLVGDEGVKVLNKVADTCIGIDSSFRLYKMKTLPELDVNIMKEKGLISSELVECLDYGAVVLSKDENISIMINERDHICEMCKLDGLNLINTYDMLSAYDNQLLSKLDIAYDDSIGFLTSDISNVGTGLKASITLFLPGLFFTGRINEIIGSLSSQGIEFDKNGDDQINSNYLFTISNNFTIGKKENEYVVRLTEIALKLCDMEIKSRTELLSQRYIDDVTDKVFRAFGILTNCYKINELEASRLLGELKMGMALDIVRFKDFDIIDKLLLDIKPYALTKISDSKVTISELDKYRAKFLCNILKSKRIK